MGHSDAYFKVAIILNPGNHLENFENSNTTHINLMIISHDDTTI